MTERDQLDDMAQWSTQSTTHETNHTNKQLRHNSMGSRLHRSIPDLKAVEMEPERLWRKGFVKEMSFKSGVKG